MEIKKTNEFSVTKVDTENSMIFGFFSIVKVGDEEVVDRQQDIIKTEDLEFGAYDFVLNARVAGERHLRKGVGQLIESMVFTKEKQEAILKTLEDLGVKDASFDLKIEGWWGGFLITDEEVMEKAEKGDYPMFSVGGKAAKREEV